MKELWKGTLSLVMVRFVCIVNRNCFVPASEMKWSDIDNTAATLVNGINETGKFFSETAYYRFTR